MPQYVKLDNQILLDYLDIPEEKRHQSLLRIEDQDRLRFRVYHQLRGVGALLMVRGKIRNLIPDKASIAF